MGYVCIIRGKERKDDNLTVPRPAGFDDNQSGPCPDCGGTWVWYEAGWVPGTRKCQDCGSFFNFRTVDGKSVRGADTGWLLVRQRMSR